MSQQRKQGFCKHCNQLRPVTRPGTNHILHLLITVFTAGMWLFIWFLASIKIGGWRCENCGSKKIKNVS